MTSTAQYKHWVAGTSTYGIMSYSKNFLVTVLHRIEATIGHHKRGYQCGPQKSRHRPWLPNGKRNPHQPNQYTLPAEQQGKCIIPGGLLGYANSKNGQVAWCHLQRIYMRGTCILFGGHVQENETEVPLCQCSRQFIHRYYGQPHPFQVYGLCKSSISEHQGRNASQSNDADNNMLPIKWNIYQSTQKTNLGLSGAIKLGSICFRNNGVTTPVQRCDMHTTVSSIPPFSQVEY